MTHGWVLGGGSGWTLRMWGHSWSMSEHVGLLLRESHLKRMRQVLGQGQVVGGSGQRMCWGLMV